MKGRVWILTAAASALALLAGGYIFWARQPGTAAGAPVTLDGLTYLSAGSGTANGKVTRGDGGSRTVSGLACTRFYSAGGTGLCLRPEHGAVTRYHAIVLDRNLKERRRVELPGAPSRARVSAGGHLAAWTVFVAGDSYLASGLSTRTGIADLRTGQVIASLEELPLYRDGARVTAVDVNYWGVTFAADEDAFYVSVKTGDVVYLAKGSLRARRMDILRGNAECPSLSPDGTRVAYKKRVRGGEAPWRFHVLDLASGRETPLAETASVDDQIAWLDPDTLMYAKVRGDTSDVWSVPADGSGAPRLLVKDAFSPAPPEDAP
ncbi:TolB family protein [Thermoactinospora rubra]|uniref:TolB family protein n=1 Tax=Thermoactinospora rubra TaxID=1088767 RepID=UPI00197D76F7|nr:hypothetical protein [Thermoactinospora rubra]